MINNFGEISENKKSLTWESKDKVISIEIEGFIESSSFSSKNDLVLILVRENGSDDSALLYGFTSEGCNLFKVCSPKDYWFYYLASHVNHEAAVVCVSKGNALDWYFSINPETGELRSLNRAY